MQSIFSSGVSSLSLALVGDTVGINFNGDSPLGMASLECSSQDLRVHTSLVPKPSLPAFVTCSTKAGGTAGRI